MSNQPHGDDAHDPIFKVHRHPLSAIGSIAAGLTSSGACRNPSERRWDARAWTCATRFVTLPVSRESIAAQTTCGLSRESRLRLALHYWVKWNLLADRWAARTFAIETLSVADVAQRWCDHCARADSTCACPLSARAVIGNATAMRREHVRARRGHGKRRSSLDWPELEAVDFNMTLVARQLAKDYGYPPVPEIQTAFTRNGVAQAQVEAAGDGADGLDFELLGERGPGRGRGRGRGRAGGARQL